MDVIGITGGVACGKSMVTEYLRKQGFEVIDADEMVAALHKKKAIREEIHNHFQTNDKEKIREIIFANPAAKEVLESILHPLVHKEIEKLIQKHRKQKTPILFFVIPLLFETHMENLFDTTVAIVSSQKNQEARLIKRDNISLEQAQKIIYSQIPNARKAELANYTLTNNGTQKALQQKVSTLLKKIQS